MDDVKADMKSVDLSMKGYTHSDQMESKSRRATCHSVFSWKVAAITLNVCCAVCLLTLTSKKSLFVDNVVPLSSIEPWLRVKYMLLK